MHERSVLGPADVTDEELAAIVADWLGASRGTVELVDSYAEVVPYDLDAITTAGRFWVRGTARTAAGAVPFSFFVKHVQSWSRSPLFAQVPPEHQEMAEAGVPWQTEPLIYRSDLADRLPQGLTMPRAVAVRDLDDKSGAVWLEEVQAVEWTWTIDQLAQAAYLLGRLAASPSVRELASIGERARSWPVRSYVEGRLSLQILPMLRGEEIWHHPLVAAAFDPGLRVRMLAAGDRVMDYLAEVEQVPLGTAHGDACTNNLLVQPDSDELVLIDYGFWTTQPLGFDLGQLLLGDVQIGRRPASCLGPVENACLPAYVEGLRDEGCDVDAALVRRAHALQMLIYSGLSAIPVEHLGERPTPELHRIGAERAAAARFMLDLVDATA
ncbi:MAG: aminoglycoside phosphotransferase family protein [Actinomycetota bacterium]|nr:aminoglycoside phosphotransferase family protein [Actinomycetota bacterium]